MAGTLSRYFLRRYLSNFFSTLVAIFGLVYLIDVIELSRRGKFDEVPFTLVAVMSALRVPSFVEQAFPFVVLFASVFTLITLNRRYELVVARAAGVSVWQILRPFLVGSVLLGIAATLLYNPLAAYTQALSNQIETSLAGKAPTETRLAPWLRQNSEGVDSIIGAKAVSDHGLTLGGVTAFVMDGEGKVKERVDAPKARLEPGAWILDTPTVTEIGETPHRVDSLRLPTSLRPEFVEQRLADPQAIPIWDLYSKIEIARSLGYNAQAFAMHFNTLIAKPALFVAMTLVAATVAVRFARTGQSGRTIFGGVAAGFVLYVVTFLAQALGSNSVVPPVVAAWFPVVAAGLFGVTILLHQEDG
ncbi:LPS export ABC transporter permease LptG [Aureimonas endophytica]|uniref:LPS export ABC transporter permease LptG n=1 Tax=Aureimonas endophytica TaxID=2027858 RepID=A0A917E0R6_9HYPH|nr:LPS export ABC transporter permease LptG [Aureimonas endophytica]GGD85671.1 LPS export ABC transporter permease LptG [Aureimonas endophytica]